MKQNKDFWNGYISHMLKEQFSFWDGKHEGSLKIDNILDRYHAEIIQNSRNFNKYAAPLLPFHYGIISSCFGTCVLGIAWKCFFANKNAYLMK